MADKRKKGCPNMECEAHKNKVKRNADDSFCPKCGSSLVFVCAKCFDEIEDLGESHRICLGCEAEAESKKEKAKDMAKNFGKGAFEAGAVVLAAAKKEAVKEVAKGAAKVAGKVVKGIPKIIKR